METEKSITLLTPFAKSSCAGQTAPRRRVAGYARVSTEKDEQASSYENQIRYYTDLIVSRADWELVKIYTDEGVTGTSIKKRKGFSEMIRDALDGRIDLIVTKSVSRFARNTVDSLLTIRKLKDVGCEVYFEKENIFTFDSQGELLITIMSSIAQEEARSISKNVSWGIQRMHASGRTTLPFSEFLGYRRGENGEMAVDPAQAKTVIEIYRLFLAGYTPYGIAKHLTLEKIPSPTGKPTWYSSVVRSILTNEKYKGDLLIQKTYTKNYLTKEKAKNRGEVPQYYVKGDHEAIIPEDVFENVQAEMKRREGEPKRVAYAPPFFGCLICGECGSVYGPKKWHTSAKKVQTVWVCNRKYRCPSHKCTTPNLTESEVRALLECRGIVLPPAGTLAGIPASARPTLPRIVVHSRREIDIG